MRKAPPRSAKIPVGRDPGPFDDDVDEIELKRRSVGWRVRDNLTNSDLTNFRAPGEGGPPPRGRAVAPSTKRRQS